MKEKSDEYQQEWWFRATQASLTGWMFAMVVAIVFVILQVNEFPPIKSLEQAGIDFGMKRYSREPAETSAYEYVFIDVDQEACKLYMRNIEAWDPECRMSKPVPVALIIDFVKAAVASNAKLVIIDVSPPEKHEELERDLLAKALGAATTSTGTWIIAPYYARPSSRSNGFSLEGDSRFDIVSDYGEGKLRLASALTFSDHGIIRSYPIASCLINEKGSRWVPTIPYLAALLVNPQTEKLANNIYFSDTTTQLRRSIENPYDCNPLETESQQSNNRLQSTLPLFDPFDLKQAPPVIQFFYSIPGISLLSNTQNKLSDLWEHSTYYAYYLASKLIDPERCTKNLVNDKTIYTECFPANAALLGNKIIVLGSSRAQALDQVETPIGPMSGSELIINAIRAFLEFKPLEQPSPLAMLWSKSVAIAIAMIPMTVAWFLIFLSSPALQKLRAYGFYFTRQYNNKFIEKLWERSLSSFRSIAVVLIFLMGIYCAYLLELIYLTHQLEQGVAVDLLLPAVALGLQGFAVTARVISTFFQKIAEMLIRLVIAVVRK